MTLAATLGSAAAARSQAWWLLSRFLLKAPDEAFIRDLGAFLAAAAERAPESLAPHLGELLSCVRMLDGKAIPVEVAVDYTRLISGVYRKEGMPPVESAVRQGRTLGDAGAATSIAYAQAGFPDPCPEAGPPDHAATGLRFLALCCHAESQAWQAGDLAAGSAWLQRERNFLQDHVITWLPDYCDSAAARAATPLYSSGLRLVAATCRADLDDVMAMLAEVDLETALPQTNP